MTKFKRVLSDEYIVDIVSGLAWSSADTLGFGKEVAEHIQQAVLAKLAEQEPVMFARTYNGEIDWDEDCITEDDDGLLLDGLTHVNDDGDFEVEEGYAAIPLYAHPMPPTEQKPIGYLHANGISFLSSRRTTAEQARAEDYNTPLYAHPHPEMQKPFTPRDAVEMRDFIGMHFGSLRYANPETEEPSDDDWYTLSIHDLLSAFSWAGHYGHEGLSTTYSAATTPEGWQLVPKEPTEEMHRAARDWSVEKYGKAIGFEASHGCYKYMLAAAPKYEGK